ncbi:MAG: hypothetical protein AAFX99_27130 [Myxococcota bacterium]
MIDLLNEQSGPGPEDLEALDGMDDFDSDPDPDLDAEPDLDLEGDLNDIDDFDEDASFVPPDDDGGYYDSTIDDIDDFERPSRRRKPARKAKRSRKSTKKAKPAEDTHAVWQRLCGSASDDDARPYNITQVYKPLELIRHPKFGLGYVREICSHTKIEVIFEDGPRRLVCNMSD